MAEHAASPDVCPECGVVYAKVQAKQESRSVADKLAAGVAGARSGVAEARQQREEAEWQAELKRSAPDCVALTSVQIPFLSLVWLMTKVILASIPAVILAAFIIMLIMSFVSGVFSYSSY
jgi:uncharacterized protein YhaN